MSSSPRADASSTRIRSPRTWSLRARLLVSQVVLLALVCAAIGVGTELALQHFLMKQLDNRLAETGRRSTGLFELGPPPPPPPGFRRQMIIHNELGPGPAFLNAPGQGARTVGAVISRGDVVDAAVINADGTRAQISSGAAQQLTGIEPTGVPVTRELDGLGSYRLIAIHARGSGDVIVTGLPTSDVDDMLFTVAVVFCVVGVLALIGGTTAGIVIIRRQLAPLATLSDAAQQVADLELDRGEVRLPTPIVEVDPQGTHTEVGQLGSALNRMLDRIASALSARHASETRVRQFVADASHELRTPLAAIRGYTELAQRKRDDVPDDVAHAMSRVESEAVRMTQLVEDMLLLARLDTGRPLEREAVDLSRLTVDTVSDAHIAGPDHKWSLELPDEPVVITGDEARLHQVLANLLANARIHTPPGTSVTTSLTVDAAGAAALTVADDGPGIPAWLQPEIFERFARGDSSRSRRGGSTGLGLAIVAAVVKAHGGRIEVRSVPGNTRFTVNFPADSQRRHGQGNTEA
ncbi:two-component sensor histidine kinase [Mycolicibacterium sp. GF69]|uniref:sensor histidine kinase n=1 Tax=Mycolicibacterium sp. GF69 TaxID=2267251 RepID=UPI000DCC54A0|nr:HAMP domain-containing sensor histidine kinase [Mycolicibacterium sp. GF69]RAV12045.1 two-component sensor histidine kinase [Mycolicibacterium sp. GF69]